MVAPRTKYVDSSGLLIPPLRVISNNAMPVLTYDNDLIIWVDTLAVKVYLLFRRGAADQVKVELV